MRVAEIVLATLSAVSFLIVLWQWFAAARFPLRRPGPASTASRENITLLKPLKGLDQNTHACLESWLAQDYPGELQFLFGVRSAEDPACEVVRDLVAANPGRDVQLIICPEVLGPNAKVSTLIQLQRQAKHSFILVSDADVWVDPGFLRSAMPMFSETKVGLVCSLYALVNPRNIAMHLESLAVNVDFWSQVLQGRMLRQMDFALGAVMIVRRSVLEAFGGFETLVDYLADDYQFGRKTVEQGSVVALADTVVECRGHALSAGAVWQHHVRWARTIRVCQPAPYFFSILGNATLFTIIWAVAFPSYASLIAFGLVAILRITMASHLQSRLLPRSPSSPSPLILIKDLLQTITWAQAFLGSKITWRGETFTVLSNGKLEEVN